MRRPLRTDTSTKDRSLRYVSEPEPRPVLRAAWGRSQPARFCRREQVGLLQSDELYADVHVHDVLQFSRVELQGMDTSWAAQAGVRTVATPWSFW